MVALLNQKKKLLLSVFYADKESRIPRAPVPSQKGLLRVLVIHYIRPLH